MANENQADFSEFGKSFQENLACLVMQDREFSDQIQEVLVVRYFEQVYLQRFVELIFDYKNKYKTHPNVMTLKTMIRAELKNEDENIKAQVIDFFARQITSGDKIRKIENVEYVRDKSIDFCKKQKLYQAMERSIEILPKSSFEEIRTLINEALNLGLDNNFGHDFIKDFEARYQLRVRNPISTGWPKIDSITGGGLGIKELGVVIAPTGVGKSHVLAHMGSQGIRAGKQVVHYTCELAAESTGRRYDACLTGVPLDNLREIKDKVFEEISKFPGALTIKEYPTKTASTRTIRNHLDKLFQRGTEPELVIVDYADLLRPTASHKEKRFELESTYEELRAIAGEYAVPVWTASQTNRGGLNLEVITMESISEAFNKCFVADFIFSVSRTIDDREANTGKMFIAKSRLGVDGLVFPILFDPSNVNIKVIEEPVTVAGVTQTVKEKADKKLKDFYRAQRANLAGGEAQ